MTLGEKINQANAEALKRILGAQPTLVGMGTAGEDIPGMTKKTILHAGPPVTWDKMCGPVRGAIIGGLIYEGLASNKEEAEKLAASGEITFDSCHHHNAVGPMAGIVTYSMPVWKVVNKTYGNYAYCTFNEGLGKVLRFGAFGDEVITRLKWLQNTLYPIIKEALEIHGEINLKTMIAQVLQMGDEGHNRNKAGTSLLIREIAPAIVATHFSQEEKIEALKFLNSNDHTFLNLTMPACKSTMDPVGNIPYSTIVYTMARNGTEFGIRVSGLGNRWFTAPAEIIDGLYFPGFTSADANPDVGDSCITETTGIGGFCMAAAPRSSSSSAAPWPIPSNIPPRCTRLPRVRATPIRSRRSTSAAAPPASTSARLLKPASARSSTPASPPKKWASVRSAPALSARR